MANVSPRAREERSGPVPSVWKGYIWQDNESFATTVLMWERGGELLEGEIRFTMPWGFGELTFEGRIVDRNTITPARKILTSPKRKRGNELSQSLAYASG